jgi:hypothetical protein
MAVAGSMEDYLQALGLQRAYSVSLRLISSMVGRQRTSWQLSATRRKSGAGLWES